MVCVLFLLNCCIFWRGRVWFRQIEAEYGITVEVAYYCFVKDQLFYD